MRKLAVLLVLVLGLAVSGCGEKPELFKTSTSKSKPVNRAVAEKVSGTVLANASGRVITLEDFNQRVVVFNQGINDAQDIPSEIKANYLIQTKEDKLKLLNGMIERELLIAEAIDRNMDQDADLLQAIKGLKEQFLFAKLIESERAKVKVAAQEAEDFYNANQAAFIVPEERKINMILLSSEVKAKEILIQLLQGADFAALARQNSIDESAKDGGDIGYIVRTTPFAQPGAKTMFAKFEEEAFSIETNKPSTIFQGEKGFYIIKATEIKDSRQRLLSEVFDDIQQGLQLRKQEETLQELVGNLRKASEIEINENLLN